MISRNSPCPCGSGKRFKHCCGDKNPVTAVFPQPDHRIIMHNALAEQRAGKLADAERLYRDAIALSPLEPDCLHMLGVICLQTHRYREAFDLVYQAAELTGWRIDTMRHNLGLIINKLLVGASNTASHPQRKNCEAYSRERESRQTSSTPLVSIIIPSYNHERWVVEALESVYGQTYRNIELIVIDDGSTDNSPRLIRDSLAHCPFPHRLVLRDNRGAHATINEGITLATGEYLNILNSDDRFADERIATLVEKIAHKDADWGFASTAMINAEGRLIDIAEHTRAYALTEMIAEIPQAMTVGFALLRHNVAISTGNLFVRRSFFIKLNSFRNFRYNHDWDFCLRATLQSEPVFVPESLYYYRLHERNTITEANNQTRAESDRIFQEYLATASSDRPAPNPYAPTADAWGLYFFSSVMRNGQGALLPPKAMQKIASLCNELPSEDIAPTDEFEYDASHHQLASANQAMASLVDTLAWKPLISILLPTFNSPEKWLRKCLNSVLAQTYPYWELCIADDASPAPHVRKILQEYAGHDERIKVAFREQNGHISVATNTALDMARGEFVALLDHDDEFTADALYWVVRALNKQPNADLIYSDEDKIDELGSLSGAYLKPDWNPELLCSQNFISHLGVYRTSLARNVGGFQKGYEGAQDWDLALRISEQTSAENILHIPRILYHWRAIEGSTAQSTGQKSYVVNAQKLALAEHYQRLGQIVSLKQVGDFWNAFHTLPKSLPLVSLILDGRHISISDCTFWVNRLLHATSYANLELILCSPIRETMHQLPDHVMQLTIPRELSIGGMWHRALEYATGEVIGILSAPATPAHANWLDILVGYAIQPKNGAVAPKALTPDGRIAFAGCLLGVNTGIGFPYLGQSNNIIGQAGRARLAQNFQALASSMLLVARKKLPDLMEGSPDYQSNQAWLIELCLKLAEAGYWNVWVPMACITQTELSTTPDTEDLTLLHRNWPKAFHQDPAYHPALSRSYLWELP